MGSLLIVINAIFKGASNGVTYLATFIKNLVLFEKIKICLFSRKLQFRIDKHPNQQLYDTHCILGSIFH